MWAETFKFIVFCITMLIICAMAIDFIKYSVFFKNIKDIPELKLNDDEKEKIVKIIEEHIKKEEK